MPWEMKYALNAYKKSEFALNASVVFFPNIQYCVPDIIVVNVEIYEWIWILFIFFDTKSKVTTTITQPWNPAAIQMKLSQNLLIHQMTKLRKTMKKCLKQRWAIFSIEKVESKTVVNVQNSSVNDHEQFKIELVDARFESFPSKIKMVMMALSIQPDKPLTTMITLPLTLALFA